MIKIYSILFLVFLLSCKGKKNVPDVSGIKADVVIERFENDFFNIDTGKIEEGLGKVKSAHPDFYPDFMQNILKVNEGANDTTTIGITKAFVTGYKVIYDTIREKYQNIKNIQKEIEKGFQYVKFYYPSYNIPRIITFVAPFDAPGVALSSHYIAIGLQQFGGVNLSAYHTGQIQEMYPEYISRRFDREYITSRCFGAVVEDLYPDKSPGKPLIEQMIEKGKQWFLLDYFLPETPDSVKTGYTQKQLKWCEANEGLIWSYIIQNENLYAIEPNVIQTYIGESPSTQSMSDSSPGNIGQWIGWQVVKKFAAKNSNLKPEEIMRAEPKQILDEAKYKPK